MNVNKSLLAAALAGVSLMASAAAQASSPTASVAGGSDLILSVLDTTTGDSYTLDTGINQATFLNAGSFASQTISNSSTDTGWQTFYATIASGDSVQFQVESGNNVAGTTYGITTTEAIGSAENANYATVAATEAGLLSKIKSGTAVNAFNSTLNIYLDNINNSTNSSSNANDTYSLSSADLWNIGLLGDSFGTKLAVQDVTGVPVGSAADFFYATYNGSPKAASAALEGAFNFTIGSNGNATLSYTSASAVPVPAAAWMMLSGLMGVLSLNRRKKSV